jgi:hypothetical protein
LYRCPLFDQDNGWTTLEMHGEFMPVLRQLLRHIPAELDCRAFLVAVADGAFWGDEFFSGGVAHDCFVSRSTGGSTRINRRDWQPAGSPDLRPHGACTEPQGIRTANVTCASLTRTRAHGILGSRFRSPGFSGGGAQLVRGSRSLPGRRRPWAKKQQTTYHPPTVLRPAWRPLAGSTAVADRGRVFLCAGGQR